MVTYGSTLTLLFYDFSAKAPKLPTENLDVLFKETFRRSQTSSLAKDGETPSGILQNIVERKLSEFEARRHWSSLIAISADSLSPAMSEKLPLDSKAPIKLRVQKLLTEVYPGSAFFWLKSAIVYFEYAYSSVNATESTAGTTTPLTQECGVAFKNALSRGDLNPLHDTTSVSILLKLITTFTDIPCLEPRGAIYSVPIDLWIKLAPQVFALLNSGSIAAVQVAILVIQRMATERLQAILYTLLSESSRMPVGHGRQELEDIISRAKDGPHRGSIEEAQKFLLELNRVSILWDERWCHELTLVSTFLPKTLRRFKGESIKIINMTCLDETGKERMTRETYEILMDPVISSIRKLRDETVRIDSKTPFEKSFQSKYTSGLENMLDSLREPPSPDCVESIYSSVKNVSGLSCDFVTNAYAAIGVPSNLKITERD